MPPRMALCLEQTLGHRSHAENIVAAVARNAIDAAILPIAYSPPGRIRLPWALRGSQIARAAVRKLHGQKRADVHFYHTQTVSLFAPWTTSRPYVVSVDATPLQFDDMGQWYRHAVGPRPVERAKTRWYRTVFSGARGVVSWSEWAAESLVRDYGVAREAISVVHPGAPRYLFEIERQPRPGKPHILFVGGDLERKGGNALLRAFEPLRDRAELILMTESDVGPLPGVEVLSGARPGDSAFIDAFARADVFCLPTMGDCTPVALGEALAAGLPVVTTSIGSNHETVRDGETGLLVEPGAVDELRTALTRLVECPGERATMGRRAREDARDRFSAEANAEAVLSAVARAGA